MNTELVRIRYRLLALLLTLALSLGAVMSSSPAVADVPPQCGDWECVAYGPSGCTSYQQCCVAGGTWSCCTWGQPIGTPCKGGTLGEAQ
jgi:hypothetical protein